MRSAASTQNKQAINDAFEDIKNGRVKEAQEFFEKMISTNDPMALCGLARCYDANHEYEKAIEIYQNNIKKFPHLIRNYKSLPFSLLYANRIKEAFDAAKNVKKLFPNTLDAHLCEIHLYRKQGNVDEALKKYAMLLTKFPNNKKIKSEMLCLISNPNEDILNQFEKLLENKEGFTEKGYRKSALHFCFLLGKAKRYDEALPKLKQLMNDYPDFSKPYVCYAAMLKICNSLGQAIETFKNTVERFPYDYKANLLYCIVLQETSEYDEFSKTQIEKAIKKFPLGKELYHALSIWYLENAGKDNDYLQTARCFAEKALEIDVNYAPAYSQIGHCYKMMSTGSGKRIGAYLDLNLYKKAMYYFSKANDIDKSRINRHAPKEDYSNVYFEKKKSEWAKKYSSDDGAELNAIKDKIERKNSIIELLNQSTTTEKWSLIEIGQKQNCRELSESILSVNERLNLTISEDWNKCENLIQHKDFSKAQVELRRLLFTLNLHDSVSKSNEFVPAQIIKMQELANKGVEFKLGIGLIYPSAPEIEKPILNTLEQKEDEKNNIGSEILITRQESKQEASEIEDVSRKFEEESVSDEVKQVAKEQNELLSLFCEISELYEKAKKLYSEDELQRRYAKALNAYSNQFDDGKFSNLSENLLEIKKSLQNKISIALENKSEISAPSITTTQAIETTQKKPKKNHYIPKKEKKAKKARPKNNLVEQPPIGCFQSSMNAMKRYGFFPPLVVGITIAAATMLYKNGYASQ